MMQSAESPRCEGWTMIETRLDMQRAKRLSFARSRPETDDADLDLAADRPATVTGADDLPAMMDADPTQA